MSKKIIITGATGLIGTHIVNKLIMHGDETIVLTRNIENAKIKIPGAKSFFKWNPNNNFETEKNKEWVNAVEETDAIINLAGENIMSKRWSDSRKQKIFSSRVNSVKLLYSAVSQSKKRPEVFISASAIGYYGKELKGDVTEESTAGTDFLSDVVKQWEDEQRKFENLGIQNASIQNASIRNASIRIGIVLDKDAGALNKMLLPFKLFIGGPLGKGTQWFPWVHIDDIADIFLFVLDNKNVQGEINAVSPHPVTMNDFVKILGKVIKRPSVIKVPEFVLKIVMGEASGLVTKGVKVIPQKLIKYGYNFNYDNVEKALINLLRH